MDPKTVSKTHVYSNRKDATKKLLSFLPPELLPKEYGGTCKCVGGCARFSKEEVAMAEFCHYVNTHSEKTSTGRYPLIDEPIK
jgi:hypothetical protein